MTRVGSRRDPLLSALLAGADAGAFTLPPAVVENRDRLAGMQSAVAALRPPEAESQARAVAVRDLLADPGADVAASVLAARQADAGAELHADLLRQAADTAADALDCLDAAEVAVHLQRAFSACVSRLKGAYTTFSRVSTNPDDLWGAPQPVTSAWTSFTRAAAHYEQIRTVWTAFRAGSPATHDHEGLFLETKNLADLWPERVTGLRPASTMAAPWPPRSDVLAWLLWMLGHGAVLHLPTASEQDAAWSVVFGARAAEFGRGDRHVSEMRELFG